MTKKAEREAQIAANRREAYIKRVKTLTGFLFGRIDWAELDAAFAAGVTADAHAAAVAAKSPVGAAVHPMKIAAIARARKNAEEKVEKVRADLEAHDMDLNAAAPRPHWRTSNRPDYKDQMAKHNLYSRLTRSARDDYRRDDPTDIRAMNPDAIARFVTSNEEDAALQYDMFICKLVSKVGEVTDASIAGNHVWGESYLTVTTIVGTKQTWKTQQIVNVSSLGNYFNQWPTRLMK